MITLLILLLISCLLFGGYLFLILPRVKDRADMDLLCTEYAHRGLWGEGAPENSMTAFSRAMEKGYGIELDVRITKDGELVVFHDESLTRLCGIKQFIRKTELSDIKQLTIQGTEEKIPTLSEVLALVEGKVPLLIEIKASGKAGGLCRRLTAILDHYDGAFAIESFNPKILAWFKQYRPRYARGQLLTRVEPGRTSGAPDSSLTCFALSHMLLNFLSRPDFISIDGRCTQELSFRLLNALFRPKIFVWTVRTPKQYRACRTRGFFTIFEQIRP